MEVLTSGYGLVEVRAWETEAGGYVSVETNMRGVMLADVGRRASGCGDVGPVDVAV